MNNGEEALIFVAHDRLKRKQGLWTSLDTSTIYEHRGASRLYYSVVCSIRWNKIVHSNGYAIEELHGARARY